LPASFIHKPKQVLILGGGCLFAAREVLKYPTITSVEQIEHDSVVIQLIERHYPHARHVLSDRRFNLRIGDARRVLDGCDSRYDLIVCDCFDLAEENQFRSPSVYVRLQSLLTPTGLCTDVVYRHVFDRRSVRMSLRGLSECDRVAYSLMAIPEYPGVFHLHTIWGRNRFLSQTPRKIRNSEQLKAVNLASSIKFDFYDPRHRAFFLYLPPYLKDQISKR
jgi:spermidine synthase